MKRVSRVPGVAKLAVLVVGAALATAGRAEAQWGNGYGFGAGYGYGGWGWGGGFGPFGGMGTSLYDQAMIKEQYYMDNAARWNLQNSMAVAANQQANLMQQQAVNTALQNQRMAYEFAKEKYDVRTRQAASSQAAQAQAPPVPIDNLINGDGQVLWPGYAPANGAHAERRQRADEAIRVAYNDYKKDGHAGVQEVVDAKHRLYDYGRPALSLLGTRGDSRTRAEMVQFLNALDSAVESLAGPQNQAAPQPAAGN